MRLHQSAYLEMGNGMIQKQSSLEYKTRTSPAPCLQFLTKFDQRVFFNGYFAKVF
jgi:hypothetical protein